MSSPAELVKQKLDAAGVGASGTNLFVGVEPESPDACIVCYDSGGLAPDPKWALDRPAVQVRVRSAKGNYAAGYTKALAVKDALLGITPDTTVRGIVMRGELAHLGTDESRRHLFSLNFLLMVQPATTGNRTSL